jgi:hypothetical protein
VGEHDYSGLSQRIFFVLWIDKARQVYDREDAKKAGYRAASESAGGNKKASPATR